jgi:hypothetical protein
MFTCQNAYTKIDAKHKAFNFSADLQLKYGGLDRLIFSLGCHLNSREKDSISPQITLGMKTRGIFHLYIIIRSFPVEE